MSKIEVHNYGPVDEAVDGHILVFSDGKYPSNSPVMYPGIHLLVNTVFEKIVNKNKLERWGLQLYNWLVQSKSDEESLNSLQNFDGPSRYVEYFLSVIAQSTNSKEAITMMGESFLELFPIHVLSREITNADVRSILYGFCSTQSSAEQAVHQTTIDELTKQYSPHLLHMVCELLELFYSRKVWPIHKNGEPHLLCLQGCQKETILFRSIVPEATVQPESHVTGCVTFMRAYDSNVHKEAPAYQRFSVGVLEGATVVYQERPHETSPDADRKRVVDTVSAVYVASRRRGIPADCCLIWCPHMAKSKVLPGTWGFPIQFKDHQVSVFFHFRCRKNLS